MLRSRQTSAFALHPGSAVAAPAEGAARTPAVPTVATAAAATAILRSFPMTGPPIRSRTSSCLVLLRRSTRFSEWSITFCQDDRPVLGDGDRVLGVRRAAAVDGGQGP